MNAIAHQFIDKAAMSDILVVGHLVGDIGVLGDVSEVFFRYPAELFLFLCIEGWSATSL